MLSITATKTRARKKDRTRVLTKVAAALSEFVTPITNKRPTTHATAAPGGPNQQDFKRAEPPRVGKGKEKGQRGSKNQQDASDPKSDEQKSQPETKQAKVIPINQNAADKNAQAAEEGGSQSFLQLITQFRDQRLTLLGWNGQKTYSKHQKSTKKSAGTKRGSILDHEAE